MAEGIPKAAKRQIATIDAYSRVFGSPDGQLVLVDLIKKAGVLEATHEPGMADYNNGRRSLALDIMAMLRMDAAKLLELVQRRLDENPEED